MLRSGSVGTPVAAPASVGAPMRSRCVSARARLLNQRPDLASDDIRATVSKAQLITAVKTPYLENGKIDLTTYDAHLAHQVAHGVDGVIVGGTTGEGQLMSWDEHVMLIAHTVNAFGDKLVVIGNTGSNSTREALHATEQGFAVGMHAALSINPYYGKTSKRGVVSHLNACMDEGPTIVYNVAARTAQDVTPDLVMQLAEHPNFLGMKECAGNDRIATYAKEGIKCWSGNDDEFHDGVFEHGAVGVISVTSNLIPGLCKKLCVERDVELNASLQELIGWLFHEPNPIPINTAMMQLGMVKPVFRQPYVPCDKAKREEGVRLLNAVLKDIPGAQAPKVMEEEDFILLKSWC